MRLIPGIFDRSTNNVTLSFFSKLGIDAYRINGANTLDNAYGASNGVGGTGTETMFDVATNTVYRSKSIRKRGLGLFDESHANQTRAIYDPDDFFNPPTTTVIPPDSDLAFLRIQVKTTAKGAFPAAHVDEGPIVIVPTPDFYAVPRPALSLFGTAPTIAAAAAGSPPPLEALAFHVPSFADAMVITNHDGTNPLLFSMGYGLPMIKLDKGVTISHSSGMKDTIIVAAPVGNPKFSLLVAIVTGLR